jgi:hypothetical protein
MRAQWSRLLAQVALLASVSSVMGCAVVDQYSGRAVVYNLEAEQAQEQSILLNVVRAYLRRPMQFTTVSTITGTASASAGAQYTLPTQIPFRPTTNGSSIAGFPPVPTWQFTGSMSGGPAFTVPVLDTQEFYSGIMKPITGQMYDLYLQGNYPHDELFNLFVQRVIMTRDAPECRRVAEPDPSAARHGDAAGADAKPSKDKPVYLASKTSHLEECEHDFHNSVSNEVEFALFQALGDYLASLGLSTEALQAKDPYFDNSDNDNRIFGVQVKLTGSSPAASTDSGSAGGGGGGGRYVFCFAPRKATYVRYVLDDYACAIPKTDEKGAGGGPKSKGLLSEQAVETARKNSLIKPTGQATGKIKLAPEFIDRLIAIACEHNRTDLAAAFEKFKRKTSTGEFQQAYLLFRLRSVESMIFYLGEVVRAQLAPESGHPRTVFIKVRKDDWETCAPGIEGCQRIFVLKDTPPLPGDFVSVFYAGRWFTIPSGPGAGYSSSAIEIIKQQLALNSSAKSLPQSSVITVAGGQ